VKPNLLDNVFQASYTTKQDGMGTGYLSVAPLSRGFMAVYGQP
jgi:hypothetical protein